MSENNLNIGQAVSVSEQKPIVPQINGIVTEIWRLFSRIVSWVKENYCTEKKVREIVTGMMKSQILLIKQMPEPEFVPEGFVAVYADSNDGNQPKFKYNTGSGEGVVIRMVYQENEANES